MKLASLNVNRLRSHLDDIKKLVMSLDVHALAPNKTKLDSNYPKELTSIPGYHQERLDRTAHGRGISVYIGDSLKYTLRSDVPVDELEIICVENNPPKNKPFLVLAWYRPPSNPVSSFNKLEQGRATSPVGGPDMGK